MTYHDVPSLATCHHFLMFVHFAVIQSRYFMIFHGIHIYIYIFMGFIYIHHGLGLCCGFLYPMMGHHDPWGYGLWDGYFLPVMLWDFWAPWCATKGSAAHIFEFWSTLTSKNWNVPYKTWGFDFCVSTMRSFGVKHLKSAKITKRHNYY